MAAHIFKRCSRKNILTGNGNALSEIITRADIGTDKSRIFLPVGYNSPSVVIAVKYFPLVSVVSFENFTVIVPSDHSFLWRIVCCGTCGYFYQTPDIHVASDIRSSMANPVKFKVATGPASVIKGFNPGIGIAVVVIGRNKKQCPPLRTFAVANYHSSRMASRSVGSGNLKKLIR